MAVASLFLHAAGEQRADLSSTPLVFDYRRQTRVEGVFFRLVWQDHGSCFGKALLAYLIVSVEII